MESGAKHQIPNAPKTNMDREVLLMILQFLKETSRMESAHRLEMETGIYLDTQYLEDLIMKDEYLKSFTNPEEEQASTRIFFEIRKHQYYEALNRNDKSRAFQILQTDLDEFRNFKIYNELLSLLTCRRLQDHVQYESDEINRRKLVSEVKGLLHTHSRLKHILKMPSLPKDSLRNNLLQSVQFTHLINCTDFLASRQTLILPPTDINSLTELHKCEAYLVEGPKPNNTEEPSLKRKVSNGGLEETKRSKKDSLEDELPCWYATSLITKSRPTVVSFLPSDQKVLLVGQENGEVAFYDVSEGDVIMSIACSKGHAVKLLAVSPSGSHIAVVANDNDVIYVYLAYTTNRVSQQLWTLSHKGVNSIQFLDIKDTLCLVAVSDLGSIVAWNMEDQKIMLQCQNEKTALGVAAGIFDDTPFVASILYADKSLGVWLFSNSQQIQCVKADTTMSTLAICQNKLITCGDDKDSLVQWDIQYGKTARKYEGYTGSPSVIPCVDFIKEKYITVSETKQLKFWSLEDEKILKTINLDMDTKSMSVNSSGNLLAVSPKASLYVKIYGTSTGVSSIKNKREPSTVVAQKWTPNKGFPRTPPLASVVVNNISTTSASKNGNKTPEDESNQISKRSKSDKSEKTEKTKTKSDKSEITENSKTNEPENIPTPIKIKSIPGASVIQLYKTTDPVRKIIYTSTGLGFLSMDEDGGIDLFKNSDMNLSSATYQDCEVVAADPYRGKKTRKHIVALTKTDAYLVFSLGYTIHLLKIQNLDFPDYCFYFHSNYLSVANKWESVKIANSNPHKMTCLSFAMPDNNHFIAAFEDGSMRISCIRERIIFNTIHAHKASITALTQWSNYIISADATGVLAIHSFTVVGEEAKAKFTVTPTAVAKGLLSTPILNLSLNRLKGTVLVAQATQLTLINIKNGGVIDKYVNNSNSPWISALFTGHAVPVIYTTKSKESEETQIKNQKLGDTVTLIDHIYGNNIKLALKMKNAIVPAATVDNPDKVNETDSFFVANDTCVELHQGKLGNVIKTVTGEGTINAIEAHPTKPLACVIGTTIELDTPKPPENSDEEEETEQSFLKIIDFEDSKKE